MGVGGVCCGDATPPPLPTYRSRPPNVKLAVQPLIEGPMLILQRPPGAILGLIGSNLGPREVKTELNSKLKWAKNAWFSFLGEAHSTRGSSVANYTPVTRALVALLRTDRKTRVTRMPSRQKDNDQIISYLMVPGLQLSTLRGIEP